MDDLLKAALEIVKAQASSRAMTEEEIISMIKSVAIGIGSICSEQSQVETSSKSISVLDPKKAIKEASVKCLECGKTFKVITKKHLASHGLTSEEYRDKYGYKKGTALAAKSLVRERRAKMKDMKLWERRKKAN